MTTRVGGGRLGLDGRVEGNDGLYGRKGDDYLEGGPGVDHLSWGPGSHIHNGENLNGSQAIP